MNVTWCFRASLYKGLDQAVIDRYRNIYYNNFSIIVVMVFKAYV